MTYSIKQRVGILGGGQLGLMTLQSARDLNIECGVMDPDINAPCRLATHDFVQGSLLSKEEIIRFGKRFDRITTEFEHINCDALEELENDGIHVAPSSRTLRIIQDKGLQKEFYRHKGFPTSDFTLINSRAEIIPSNRPFPIIQKLRKLGYDGKGVVRLSNHSDIETAFDAPSVLEDWVDIHQEISIIVCRDTAGTVQSFEPVELISNPMANLLDILVSPARIESQLAQQAIEIASDLANELNMVGTLAVEFMISKSGKLLINECAPRPHNSGHHTIESCAHSQFDQHLRAVMGIPLGKNTTEKCAVMINLLGRPGSAGIPLYANLNHWLSQPNIFVHLYGKKHTKPFRKMGHVTILPSSVSEGLLTAENIRTSLEVYAS